MDTVRSLLIALAALFFGAPALAQSVSPTLTYNWFGTGSTNLGSAYWITGASSPASAVATAVCNKYLQSSNDYHASQGDGLVTTLTSCQLTGVPGAYGGNVALHLSNGGNFTYTFSLNTVRTCPGGYTLNGSTNMCDTSTEQQLCYSLFTTGTTQWLTTQGKPTVGSETCTPIGCKAKWGSVVSYTDKSTGVVNSEGPGTFTGEACTYDPTTGPKNDNCPGGTTGQVNGVTVCVPYDPNTNVIQSTSTTVTSGTSTVTTGTTTTSTPATGTTTSSTTCSDGYCSTVTNKTVSDGGTLTTSSSNLSQTQAEFCKDHPLDPQCKATSGFQGSCTAGFTCNGDATMCAIARGAWQTHCDLEADKTSSEFGDYTSAKAAAGAASSANGTGIQSETLSISSSSFDMTDALGGGTACVADRSVEFIVGGQTKAVVIPFSKVCSVAQVMGNILLAASFIVAVAIVLGGVKG